MNIELLEDIGLTKAEIKVYLALLELGSSTTGPIVEKSGASSSKIYEILEKLIQKGLVSFVITSGVKYYEASSPKRLVDYMQEKQKKLDEQAKQIQAIIPELELKRTLSKEKSETLVFKGMKGAETAFNDILTTLSKGDELVVIGFSEIHEQFQTFLKKFHQKRAKMGIKTRAVFGKSLESLVRAINELPHSNVKFYPEQREHPVAILVYKDKTLFSLPKDYLWIQVKNQRLADSFRSRFEELWMQDIHVYKGFDAVTAKFWSMLDTMNERDEYFVLGATHGELGKQIRDWFVQYHADRIKRKIMANLLCAPKEYSAISKQFRDAGDADMLMTELRVLPKHFSSPMQINLYKNNKVLMFLFGKDITCFEIESAVLHKNFKTYFDALWNPETQVLRGLDAVQTIFNEMLVAGHVDFIGARGYFIDKRSQFIDDWEKRAIASGFTMRNLTDHEVKRHRITRFSFAQTKYTLPKAFSALSVFWIYGDKVVISNWMESEPLVIVINNKNMHRLYHQQFELLWNARR